ncbi:EthD domain [Spongiibacter sp. IMCC21906]|uniref:EthD domain-containing protein n=1 Tax=Spongiibacter sp. IMCC21906 TaxID=1620392 RepID=UPI00062DE761|nr:EthD domain-containing protein [Spongiibacter sp. IMCC21906]AKH70333.1 EthD domain [Spongiibacter sp. IMCC21906]
MFSLIVCIKRKQGWSAVKFSEYWRDIHADLIRKNTEFSRYLVDYKQYHQESDIEGSVKTFGDVIRDFDGIAVLTFLSREHWQLAIQERQYIDNIRPDEFHFIDIKRCRTFFMNAVNALSINDGD